MSLRSKVATLSWFLSRPLFYGEMFHKAMQMLLGRHAPARIAAERERGIGWCRERARSQTEVLALLGVEGPVEQVADLHPDDWELARMAVSTCPVPMGGAGHLDLLYNIALALRAEHVLETGVAYGWSSLALLLAMERNGRGSLISIDMPYPKRGNEEYVGCVVPERFAGEWTLIRLPDRAGLRRARVQGPFDLVHYDSDKSVSGRRFAYPRLWESLRAGGILISDDVDDNLGFASFANQVGRDALVVKKTDGKYAGVLVKDT